MKMVFGFNGRTKSYYLGLLLIILRLQVYGQSCDCPPVSQCGACQGGINSFTFRYNGVLLPALITAEDQSGFIATYAVPAGNTFTVTGSLPDGRFEGGELKLKILGFLNATINTSCGASLFQGSTFGSFTVVGGESKDGGQLCCAPADIESIPPVISNCPGNIQVTPGQPGCSVPVDWTEPTATDNCGTVVLTSTHNPGGSFPNGTTQVVYTATDKYGNTATCTFNVTVRGNPNPVTVTGCPNVSITTIADASCQSAVTWSKPSAAGGCGGIILSSNYSSGNTFSVGTTVVRYTASDESGSSSTCSFNVTVLDNTKPVISGCSGNITGSADETCQASVSWPVPTATDNCGTVTMVSTHQPGDKFPLGTTAVTYTATDVTGNFSKCTFNVTVTDLTAPKLSGYADVVVEVDQSCDANVTWNPPTADDCGPVTLTSSHVSGDSFPLGTTEVTYTATDNKGNASTCRFNVIVEDKTAPVFQNCNGEIVVNTLDGCSAVVEWTIPNVSDNCGPIKLTSSHSPGETFPVGITEVKYTATDNNGNISFCKFNVRVKNEIPPVILNCPGDIHVKGHENGQVNVDWTEPAATASCGEVVLTSNHQPGELFPVGITAVEYKALDNSGDASHCKFNIVVTVDEIDLDIAKVVTPDGNGVNDAWIVKNIERFRDNKIVIVDRWGSVIYTASGYNNESVVWKGLNRNGGTVPTGTYFYTISVRYDQKVLEKSGFIELIR